MEILEHLKNGDFSPEKLAFIEKGLPSQIEPTMPEADAQVVVRKNEYIKINANATGNNLLFISEIYYPPSWHAYIDGKEAPIYKTNFAFRSIIVPKGIHNVEMKFHSDKFAQGKSISLGANIIVLVGLVVGIFLDRRSKKKEEKSE
jgi:uncharacterized membrane protein YfhO